MVCMKVLIILLVTVLGCVLAKFDTINANSILPCEPCEHDDLPLWHFKKMSPICGPCGQLFGTEFEYCCMCDPIVRKDCEDALRK